MKHDRGVVELLRRVLPKPFLEYVRANDGGAQAMLRMAQAELSYQRGRRVRDPVGAAARNLAHDIGIACEALRDIVGVDFVNNPKKLRSAFAEKAAQEEARHVDEETTR